MRIIFIILTLFYLFFGVSPVFATISFTISNPQQSGDEVTIDVSLSGLTSSSCPNGNCYLQAAFTSQDQTKYFGFIKNNSSQWYEYISSPSTSYIQSTFLSFQPTSGAWSGQVTIRINTESSNYKGPGAYNVRTWRYTGNSTSASGYTDFLTVDIQGLTPTPSPTPSSTPTPISTPNPTPTLTPTPKKSSTPNPTPTPSSKPSSTPAAIPTLSPSITSSVKSAVAGVAKTSQPSSPSASPTSSPLVEIASQKQNNPFVFIGIIFIIGGVGSLGYIFLRKNEAVYKYFRRRN